MKLKVIENSRSRYDYEFLREYTAGMILTGSEVKSIRNGNASITEGYVYIKDGEMFAKNIFIGEYKEANIMNHEERRDRKLLLNKHEIREIEKMIQSGGRAIVPVKMFFVKNLVKLHIAVGKGKNKQDKRETIKQRDTERELRRLI